MTAPLSLARYLHEHPDDPFHLAAAVEAHLRQVQDADLAHSITE